MIKCCYCGGDVEKHINPILISPDGDFVCDETCKKNYENERDKFFNDIIHDDKKFENWLLSKDE